MARRGSVYAEEFDRALHRDDLMARIEKAGFGAVSTSVRIPLE